MSQPRLSIIPAGAVTDRSLEPRDLQVLCLLGRHIDKAGWCVRSQVKMAIEIACGRSSVQRSLERLCDAGWVEKKRRGPIEPADSQPHSSYAYRVVLDRDDFAWESATRDAVESHAENASPDDDCPPVGTPSGTQIEAADSVENEQQGAQQDGHPGAQPYVGTGAQPYVGTKNDPLERPHLERERDARARDRKTKFITTFEARWPTAATDDRQRTAYAAGELTEAEEVAALAGIPPFLENLKLLKRDRCPAGWRYLEQKRWELLPGEGAAAHGPTVHARDSAEAKALAVLFKIAGASTFFYSAVARGSTVSYPKEVTPRLAALAQAGAEADWPELDHRQAGAWEELLREFVTVQVRKHLVAGARAPWPWPPRKDGTLSTAPPPDQLMSDQDFADFK